MDTSVYRVGMYKLTVMNYFKNEIPKINAGVVNLQFFDTLLIDCEIEKIGLEPKQSKKLSVQCSEIFTIVDYGNYGFGIGDFGAGPKEWLFEKIKNQNMIVDIIPIVRITINHTSPKRYWENIPNYYLQSDIYDEDIKVGMKPRTFVINSLAEVEWLVMRGFEYSRH